MLPDITSGVIASWLDVTIQAFGFLHVLVTKCSADPA